MKRVTTRACYVYLRYRRYHGTTVPSTVPTGLKSFVPSGGEKHTQMQIWGGSSGQWAAFVCVFVSHRAAAACDLHEEPEAHTYARAKACEAMLLDGELARFISCGRLNAKVDKVDNVVHTTRADLKSKKYQEIIKSGDVLLNRIQQLARVVSI